MNRQPYGDPYNRRMPEQPMERPLGTLPPRKPMNPVMEMPPPKEKKRHFWNREPKERRRGGFFRVYFLICGILVNVYGLIWLLIKLFTKLGNVLP